MWTCSYVCCFFILKGFCCGGGGFGFGFCGFFILVLTYEVMVLIFTQVKAHKGS